MMCMFIGWRIDRVKIKIISRGIRVGGLPYLRAMVTLAGGLTFSLENTPGRLNLPTQMNCLFATVSKPFQCNRALSCPVLQAK